MEIKLKELKKLPTKSWSEAKTYNSIIVINSGRKHDSGWALMYVIGLDENKEPIEIASACDDISWDTRQMKENYTLRNDMFYPSGAIHYWINFHSFEIIHALSSTTITIKRNK